VLLCTDTQSLPHFPFASITEICHWDDVKGLTIPNDYNQLNKLVKLA
jgi:hypothetical protein